MPPLNFPSSSLTVGQKYPQPSIPGAPVYTWDGEKWTQAWLIVGTYSSAQAGDVFQALQVISNR